MMRLLKLIRTGHRNAWSSELGDCATLRECVFFVGCSHA